jgi:hypothetical protein
MCRTEPQPRRRLLPGQVFRRADPTPTAPALPEHVHLVTALHACDTATDGMPTTSRWSRAARPRWPRN